MSVLVKRFKITGKIGSGSFGRVYCARDTVTGNKVAVKLESAKAKLPQVLYEAKVYQLLKGGVGVPAYYWSGSTESYNILVMELLGPSLDDIFNKHEQTFSLRDVLLVAVQLLHRLEHVHSRNYIHRDVKPGNFSLGLGDKTNIIHIIDFGLAKKYRNPFNYEHIAYCEHKTLTGTARYASIYTHLGIQQSRRDDLEALGYLLVYLKLGYLPWQGLKGNSKSEKYQRIMETKMKVTPSTLCQDMPVEFEKYLDYCKSLSYFSHPNYSLLRALFQECASRYNVAKRLITTSSRPCIDEEETNKAVLVAPAA